MDTLGQKVFSSSFLSIVSCYQFHLQEKMATFIQVLSEDQHKLVNDILTGGQNIMKHALRAEVHNLWGVLP